MSAAEKLEAMIKWELGNVACTRKNLAVWFAFWGEVTSRLIYKKLVSKSDREYHGIMKSLFVQLDNDENKAEILSLGLSSMIVGFWMDCSIEAHKDLIVGWQ